jgi:protein-disulfide isomerase
MLPAMSSAEATRRGRFLLLLIVLALLGVADGVYLTLVHVDLEVGKADVGGVCHALAANGCNVTGGRFGDLGGVPVATIGLAGAAATAFAGIMAFVRRREAWDAWRSAAYLLGLASVAASLLMAVFSTLERSYCPFCLGWYVLNFGIAASGWAAIGESQDRDIGTLVRDTLGPPALPLVAVVAFSLAGGLWGSSLRRNALVGERDAALEDALPGIVEEVMAQGKVKLDLTGLPTKGPDDADITIVEVADFECPFCKKVWDNVAELRATSSLSVRTAFIHYPLDASCNEGVGTLHEMACGAARASECARRRDKFWEYADILFERQPALEKDDLVDYAAELGLDKAEFEACLADPETDKALKKSIARAVALNVEATPTFYVNGYKFQGSVGKPLFIPLVERLVKTDAARAAN